MARSPNADTLRFVVERVGMGLVPSGHLDLRLDRVSSEIPREAVGVSFALGDCGPRVFGAEVHLHDTTIRLRLRLSALQQAVRKA